MKKSLTLALCAAALSFVALPSAHAGSDTFVVKFEYQKDDPIAVSYAAIEKRARKECMRQIDTTFRSTANNRMVVQCTGELTDLAVAESNNAELVAYHNSK
ncbi:MAG: hypothetical protein AAF337_04885 [Pseudomonadota bacterium]